MKVKGKAKQLLCMVCAFVASFLLTVTAFADFDVYNSNYFGYYEGTNNTKSFVDINSSRMLLKAYYVTEEKEYVVASSSEGRIDYSLYDVYYETGRCCDSTGKLTGDTIIDFIAQGRVLHSGGLKLAPNGQTERYVLM